jgi:hypothetical protein
VPNNCIDVLPRDIVCDDGRREIKGAGRIKADAQGVGAGAAGDRGAVSHEDRVVARATVDDRVLAGPDRIVAVATKDGAPEADGDGVVPVARIDRHREELEGRGDGVVAAQTLDQAGGGPGGQGVGPFGPGERQAFGIEHEVLGIDVIDRDTIKPEVREAFDRHPHAVLVLDKVERFGTERFSGVGILQSEAGKHEHVLPPDIIDDCDRPRVPRI